MGLSQENSAFIFATILHKNHHLHRCSINRLFGRPQTNGTNNYIVQSHYYKTRSTPRVHSSYYLANTSYANTIITSDIPRESSMVPRKKPSHYTVELLFGPNTPTPAFTTNSASPERLRLEPQHAHSLQNITLVLLAQCS